MLSIVLCDVDTVGNRHMSAKPKGRRALQPLPPHYTVLHFPYKRTSRHIFSEIVLKQSIIQSPDISWGDSTSPNVSSCPPKCIEATYREQCLLPTYC